MRFRDREDAGRTLAPMISERIRQTDLNLLAIPNGGIQVGIAIRECLNQCYSLSILFVRKLQIPYNPEAGFGAVTLDGKLYLNRLLLSRLRLSKSEIETSKKMALQSLQARAKKFGVEESDKAAFIGHTAVIVDDGLASGFTMLAAVRSIEEDASRVVVAVPTASETAVDLINSETKAEILCPDIRSGSYFAVADAYTHWRDVSDEEAIKTIRVLDKQLSK